MEMTFYNDRIVINNQISWLGYTRGVGNLAGVTMQEVAAQRVMWVARSTSYVGSTEHELCG